MNAGNEEKMAQNTENWDSALQMVGQILTVYLLAQGYSIIASMLGCPRSVVDAFLPMRAHEATMGKKFQAFGVCPTWHQSVGSVPIAAFIRVGDRGLAVAGRG